MARRISDETKDQIVDLYEGGKTARQVSIYLGISCSTVTKELKRRGIEVKRLHGKGRFIDSYGYVMVRDPSNGKGYVKEHVLVAEKKLGSKIPKGIDVHHIDENKANNHPDNLQLLKRSDHIRLHMKTGKYIPCSHCGKEIYKNNYRINNHKNLFCSRDCYSMSMQKYKLTEDEWLSLLKKHSPTELSKKMNLGRTTIQEKKNRLVKKGLL